jgi:hypothetical protein
MTVPTSHNVARQMGLGRPLVHRAAERNTHLFILWK